jgi:outer membrane protein assembly factor BamB
MTTFELVPDDEREDDPSFLPPDGEADTGPRRLAALRDRAHARWRGLSRRGRVAVAAGTAVVVVAAATAAVAPGFLDAHDQRLRAAAVQGLPGAVGDLSEPLADAWELATGDGTLVTLAGGVLLTTEGTSVSAVDAGTGSEVWQRDVGASPTCGPQGGFRNDRGTPATVAVCLSGESDDRSVTVLDATGAVVGERSLGPARTDTFDEAAPAGSPVVVPAAAGAVAVVEGITSASAPWPADGLPDEDTLRALRADGWADPTLRVEDAVTGELRGEAAVHLRAEHLEQCGMTQEEGAAPVLMTDPMVSASPSVTTLTVCAAAVLVMPDGTVLDVDADGGWAEALPGGGHVVVGDEESTVLDDDGSVVATVPGFLVPPLVDDAPDGPYLTLAGMGEGELRLTSVAPDGEEAWSAATADLGGVVARVAGVVVVQDGSGFVGFDAATGAEVWARDDLLQRSANGSGEWVVGAVTDGTRLLVGISGDGERHRLVGLDLRDGTTAWERERQGYLEGLQSIGGHVVAFDGTVHGLG